MKILFINAINPLVEVEKRYPNLGIGYLVSSLRNYFNKIDFDFKIVDSNIEDEISNFKPDLIGITSVSQNYNYVKSYAKFAKSKNIPIIVGGVHISLLPQSLSSDMNVGCIGEGEKTILELFSVFLDKGKFLNEDLANIEGIVYMRDGRLIINSPRKRIGNMDEITFPDRDMLEINRHSYMFTSRGCPYNCVFCASSRFWDKVRFFSAEYVIKEIEELIDKYNVKLISFFDDLFIADKRRLEEIVSLIKEKGIDQKVKFTCSARANLITDEVANLLKEMKVSAVGLGLESGCDKTLKYLKGGNISIENNIEAVNILKNHKIAANASFVIGSPQESKEDILETYNFIKNNPVSLFDVYVLTPYPGTNIWQYALRKNLVSNDMDWSKLNVNFNKNIEGSIILSEILNKKEVVKLYKKFKLLRLWKNSKNVWFTPQIFDLPKMFFKLIKEHFISTIKKV